MHSTIVFFFTSRVAREYKMPCDSKVLEGRTNKINALIGIIRNDTAKQRMTDD